jgi:Domain of unknown function (DUF1906)
MVPIQGVDYAWAPHPSTAALKARNIKFACRYVGTGIDDAKMLTGGELRTLRAAGIDVVANVEGSEGGFSSYANGQSWARRGMAWLEPLGFPAGRPIYFSADWDVTSGDWPDLKAALDGAASVIGRDRVGLYGGLYAIQQAQRTGAAKWFWQTYGWSTRKQPDGSYKVVWANGTHIQQYRNGVSIDGADCDLNRAIQPDYGQWGYEGVTMDWDDLLYVKNDNVTDNPNRTVRQAIEDLEKTDGVLRGAFDLKTAGISGSAPLGQLIAVPGVVAALRGQIAAQGAAIENLTAAVNALQNAQPVQISQQQVNDAVVSAFLAIVKGQTA